MEPILLPMTKLPKTLIRRLTIGRLVVIEIPFKILALHFQATFLHKKEDLKMNHCYKGYLITWRRLMLMFDK